MIQLLPDSLKKLVFGALIHLVEVSGCHISHEDITVGVLTDGPRWETSQQTASMAIYLSEDASRFY